MPRATKSQVLEAARKRFAAPRITGSGRYWSLGNDTSEFVPGLGRIYTARKVAWGTLTSLLAKIEAGGSGEKSEKPA
jgi:hypothetical protein